LKIKFSKNLLKQFFHAEGAVCGKTGNRTILQYLGKNFLRCQRLHFGWVFNHILIKFLTALCFSNEIHYSLSFKWDPPHQRPPLRLSQGWAFAHVENERSLIFALLFFFERAKEWSLFSSLFLKEWQKERSFIPLFKRAKKEQSLFCKI